MNKILYDITHESMSLHQWLPHQCAGVQCTVYCISPFPRTHASWGVPIPSTVTLAKEHSSSRPKNEILYMKASSMVSLGYYNYIKRKVRRTIHEQSYTLIHNNAFETLLSSTVTVSKQGSTRYKNETLYMKSPAVVSLNCYYIYVKKW